MGNEKLEIQYPGDPNYINQTGANDFVVWPEVEFVEEFIKGFTTRDKAITPTPVKNSNELTEPNRITLNAIEFPITNNVYENKIYCCNGECCDGCEICNNDKKIEKKPLYIFTDADGKAVKQNAVCCQGQLIGYGVASNDEQELLNDKNCSICEEKPVTLTVEGNTIKYTSGTVKPKCKDSEPDCCNGECYKRDPNCKECVNGKIKIKKSCPPQDAPNEKACCNGVCYDPGCQECSGKNIVYKQDCNKNNCCYDPTSKTSTCCPNNKECCDAGGGCYDPKCENCEE